MSYELTTRETYKGGPRFGEKINFVTVDDFDTIDKLTMKVVESLGTIHNKFEVLREWENVRENSVTKKILFKRPGKAGRLVRTFEVRKKINIVPKWDDSLI